jgi:hypothetical protein
MTLCAMFEPTAWKGQLVGDGSFAMGNCLAG